MRGGDWGRQVMLATDAMDASRADERSRENEGMMRGGRPDG